MAIEVEEVRRVPISLSTGGKALVSVSIPIPQLTVGCIAAQMAKAFVELCRPAVLSPLCQAILETLRPNGTQTN